LKNAKIGSGKHPHMNQSGHSNDRHMPSAVNSGAEPLLPGYRLVALPVDSAGAPLQVCLVVPESPAKSEGPFVLLRDLADASVYLGCIVDHALTIHDWVEVWVQNVDRFADSFPALRESATNLTLDQRWTQRAAAMRNLDPLSSITTGWESTHPRPIFFDAAQSRCVNPTDPQTNQAWELLCDDSALVSRGLPPFNTSLHRYLHLPNVPDAPLVPVTADAPQNDATRPLSEAIPELIPFNPAGGLMMVRRFASCAFEDWADLLSGKPWPGVAHAGGAIVPGAIYQTLLDPGRIRYDTKHLFAGNQGVAGRIAETFHLKLNLIAAAFRLVRSYVQEQKLPLLNVSASSFRISLAETDSELPILWSFKTLLAVPGEAVALPIETTDARYFIPARWDGSSIYRPPVIDQPIAGSGSLRIRKVTAEEGSPMVLEGTLGTQERAGAAKSELLWFRLPLPSTRVDLYAQADNSAGSAPGEIRFRTLPQQLSDEVIKALRDAEGVIFPAVPFQTIPLLSSPCDLYALAVLAVRTLLVDEEVSLPVALDELLSLARHAAGSDDASAAYSQRVRSVAGGDSRIAAALGPNRLVRELPSEKVIFPTDLWWDTIGWLTRLFPGLSAESFCRHLGDAPSLALESVFNEPLAELEKLIVRSRSLVVNDWKQNEEVRSVIHDLMGRAN
jgi:hypothetical protein